MRGAASPLLLGAASAGAATERAVSASSGATAQLEWWCGSKEAADARSPLQVDAKNLVATARSASGSERSERWCTVVERGEPGSARMGKGSESHGGEGGGERGGEGGGECKRASPSRTHTMQWQRSEWCGRCGCVSLVHATTLLHEREQLDQQRASRRPNKKTCEFWPGGFSFT